MKEKIEHKKGLNKITVLALIAMSSALLVNFVHNNFNKEEVILDENILKKEKERYLELKERYIKEKKSLSKEELREMQELFILLNTKLAFEIYEKYKIPVEVSLAQACHESDFGTSTLAQETNNVFCIKCREHSKKEFKNKHFNDCCHKHKDDHVWDSFKKFEDTKEAFEFYGMLLSEERYKGCFTCEEGDYECFVKELKKAGYATDRKYVKKVLKIITDFELDKIEGEFVLDFGKTK